MLPLCIAVYKCSHGSVRTLPTAQSTGRGSVRQYVAMCGSARGSVWQCTRQCMRQRAAVRLVVCGSARPRQCRPPPPPLKALW